MNKCAWCYHKSNKVIKLLPNDNAEKQTVEITLSELESGDMIETLDLVTQTLKFEQVVGKVEHSGAWFGSTETADMLNITLAENITPLLLTPCHYVFIVRQGDLLHVPAGET